MIHMTSEGSLWRSVRDALEASLAAGDYPPGTPLPSEARLAERFGVAIGTVRRAVDELVAARALVRRQGKGTFVPDHGPDRTLFHFFHIVQEDGPREHPATSLVEFRQALPCPDRIAPRLGLAPGAPMLFARNLQRLQGEPVMLDELWLPQALFPGLDEAGFAGRDGTVYGLYQRRFGLSVVRAEERLRAVSAPPDVGALLGLEAGAPVLRIERVAYAIGERPVELRLSWVDTRRHEYVASRA
ncbi:GntR family transcriptional regulator [Falsiroseomonas oryziterrae]|uniref:GntR family transcriptional regulator n=1 Tax=Falsiroseomonas oryziterrae TaxID=2911368 RepID=UPI001F18B87E|nr:GntR family transcriptional regulator [Roseomonas sp. NPKOSM-4]